MIQGNADTLQILVADDDNNIRESLQKPLSYQPNVGLIGTFSNGREANEFTTSHCPDALLIDGDIRKFDTYTKVRDLIKFWDMNVITLSESYTRQNLIRALRCSVRFILPEPIVSSQLMKSIRNLSVPFTVQQSELI